MRSLNAHYPVEIFGYPYNCTSSEAQKSRSKYWCPFTAEQCSKQSRLLSYPMGVCSVLHMGSKIAICPARFRQDKTVFIDVCTEVFGTINNVLLFPEIGLTSVGTFDFVLVKHEPIGSKVEDFCIVEFQTDSTTSTGQLVKALKDFMNGIDVSARRYNYGMNTYNTLKLAYIQMLYKGQVLENWNKNIVWICQEYVFDNMVQRFHLSNLKYNVNSSTHFFVYSFFDTGSQYKLKMIDKRSSTISNLITAFTKQPIHNIDTFIKNLEGKIKLNLGVTLT